MRIKESMPPKSIAKGMIFWLMKGMRNRAISMIVPRPA